jgi:hypothetical protein
VKRILTKKSTGTILLIAAGIFTIGLLVYKVSSQPPAPVYGGKSADEWFYGGTGYSARKSAESAFADMGGDALPYLVSQFLTRENSLDRFHHWIHPKLPVSIQRHIRRPVSAERIRRLARVHINTIYLTLSPQAESNLWMSLANMSDAYARRDTFYLILSVSENKYPSGHARWRGLIETYLADPDFFFRFKAAVYLSRPAMRPHSTNVIPVLVEAITNDVLVVEDFLLGYTFDTDVTPQFFRFFRNRAYTSLHSVNPSLALRIANSTTNVYTLESQWEEPATRNQRRSPAANDGLGFRDVFVPSKTKGRSSQ